MDRASDSGSEGWGFESLPVYQIKERIPNGYPLFYFVLRTGSITGNGIGGGAQLLAQVVGLAGELVDQSVVLVI